MSRINQHRIKPEQRQARRQQLWRTARSSMMGSAIVIVIGATGWWLNQTLAVTHWQIEGDHALKAAIEKQLTELADRSYLQTRPAQLHDRWMAAIPDMADVQITRILPHGLHIIAQARTPVALWQDERGHVHLVDEHHIAYRQLRQNESPDLPMLRMNSAQFARARALLDALRQQSARSINTLSEVRSSDSNWLLYFSKGERWLVPHQREHVVLTKLASILSQPRWRSRTWRIDARTPSRWFIRPAKHEGVI